MTAAAAASSNDSSVSSVYALSEEKTNGTRLARLLIDGGTHVLREFLHSIYPPATLQLVLNKNRLKLQSLKSRRVIFDSQWEKLFPTSGDPPNYKTFDISLLHLLIREICHLTPPVTGWHKMPAEDDESLEAHITTIKCYRNELYHGNSTGVANDEFEKKWKQVSSSLEALELYAYRRRIERLKNDPIDHDIQRRVEEQVNQWEELDTELARYETEQETIKVLSCLPDELPEQLMFGRTQEIQQVTEAIQSGSVPVVWITGGPGFGKTTVASKAAHELAKLEYDRTVLFCSLRSKTTLHGVATLMTLACSKNQTKPPENAEHWLLNWSKQQVSNVTFVLDNADDVLEAADWKEFMNLLEKMRTFSRQNVSFIITSRKACSTPNQPEAKKVRLGCLPEEEARQVLLSRIHSAATGNKLCKIDKLVELCGCVPLALCIAGPLLSEDYNEDEFIQRFEQEPSQVLRVDRRSTDQTSVEKSISRSFEVLDELEKKALVLLCVFPGSFDSDAAKFLIADGLTNAESVSILRELRARSLLEQISQRRYQLHQLIQTFVQKIASDKYPELQNRGKKLACSYFVSRLADNANLYWGKDTCKQAIDSFNEDRHNFEYFLQIYGEEVANQDPDLLELTTTTLATNLLQNCMYLEKCVLPRFYAKVLKGILNSTEPSNQPVRTVELLCLLGHEHRKIAGDELNEYKRLMERAQEIYSKNREDFKKTPVSEVYYLNSNARFFSEEWKNERLHQEIEESLRVCNESDELYDHPEKAATLLYKGRFAKRQQKFKEARGKLEEALNLCNNCLGEHLMTAECLKEIADLYLNLDQCQMRIDETGDPADEIMLEPLNKSHEYYEKALSMMKELGVDNHKEIILTLKNFAICQQQRGNLKEATDLFQKAEIVADRELEKDHLRKVMLKIKVAFLYEEKYKKEEEGSNEKALVSMKQGLEMAKRLGKQINKLNGKAEILAFVNRYPDEFPEDKFPRKSTASLEAEHSANDLATASSSEFDASHLAARIQPKKNGHGSGSSTLTKRSPRLLRNTEVHGKVDSRNSPRPNNVPQADDPRTTVGRIPRNRPKHYSNNPPGERGRGYGTGPISTSNRYSALAVEDNLSAPIGQKDSGDFDHQEPCSPLARAEMPENVQSDERDLRVRPETKPKISGSAGRHFNFAGKQNELRTLILKKKASNQEVFVWINESVSVADTKGAPFIRSLVTAVCEDTMDRDEAGQCKCNISRLKNRKFLLQKYIDDNTNLELQALYAVQALFVKLNHPPGFMKSYFDSFYDEEIITEETFDAWESSSEEERGKGKAVAASAAFFRWLRSAAEEVGEES